MVIKEITKIDSYIADPKFYYFINNDSSMDLYTLSPEYHVVEILPLYNPSCFKLERCESIPVGAIEYTY